MNQLMREIRFPFAGRGSSAPADSDSEQDSLAGMANEIRELDRAAEQAATRIAEAAEQLRTGAASAQSAIRADLLAGLGAALVDRTGEIRADCRKLSALMDRTAKLVAERDAGERTEARTPPPASRTAPQIADLPATPPSDDLFEPAEATPVLIDRRSGEPDRRQGAATVSEGVRLIATQMAIAGSSRTEIERRLRSQFGVRDADVALDDIFGARQSEVR